jgi:hypothetical protein
VSHLLAVSRPKVERLKEELVADLVMLGFSITDIDHLESAYIE